jgi:hypothetical protein
MNGPLSAPAAARDDQRASSIINPPGVDCRNFPTFEAEIAGSRRARRSACLLDYQPAGRAQLRRMWS